MNIDVTPLGSRLIKRIYIPEGREPCAENHIWYVDVEPGAPLVCMECGAEYTVTRIEKENLVYNLIVLTQKENEENG